MDSSVQWIIIWQDAGPSDESCPSGLGLIKDGFLFAFLFVAGTLFGLVTILGITPLLGFAVRLLPLQPYEYVAGIVVLCVVPTSLGVGISMVQSAKVGYCTALFCTAQQLVYCYLGCCLIDEGIGVWAVKLQISFSNPAWPFV